MALDKQVIDVPFTGGLSESTDQDTIAPPFLKTATNVVFDKSGSILKRGGYTDLDTNSSASSADTPAYLISHDDQLMQVTRRGELWQWNGVESVQSADGKAEPPRAPFEVDERGGVTLSGAPSTYTFSDVAKVSTAAGDWLCYMGSDLNSAEATLVIRTVDGELAVPPITHSISVNAANAPRVIGTSDRFYFLYEDTVTPAIWYHSCTVSSGVWGSWTSAAVLLYHGSLWGVCEDKSSTGFYALVGTTTPYLYRFSNTGTATANIASASATTCTRGSIYHSSTDSKVCAVIVSTTILLEVANTALSSTATYTLDSTLGSPIAATLVRVTDPVESGYNLVVAVSQVLSTQPSTDFYEVDLSGPTVSSYSGTFYWTQIRAEAFAANGRAYFPLQCCPDVDSGGAISDSCEVQNSGIIATMYAPSGSSSRYLAPVARWSSYSLHAYVPDTAYHGVSGTVPVDAKASTWDSFVFSCVKDLSDDTCATSHVQVTTPGYPAKSIRFGENTYLSGGLLNSFDGTSITECTPMYWPDPWSSSQSSGGSLSAANYKWVVVYEWEDNNGVLHRSAPSLPISITISSGSYKATLNWNGLYATCMYGGIGLASHKYKTALYRTVAGASGSYLLDQRIKATESGTGGVVTVVSSKADANLGAVLWTTGGRLEPHCPPPVQDLVAVRNRLWLINASDRSQLWYSHERTPTLAPEFNLAMVVDMPVDDCEALAPWGDGVLVLAKSGLYAIYGFGPAENGSGSDYNIQEVCRNTGCIERNSVAAGSFGVVYRSDRGIHLLPHGSNVPQYIGGAIEDSLDDSYLIMRADVYEPNSEVRFALTSDGETVQSILVWNYEVNAWSKFDTSNLPSLYDTIVHDGAHHILAQASGVHLILQEGAVGTRDRDTSYVTAKIRTGWIELGGKSGYQRIWRVNVNGRNTDDHQLDIKTYINHSDTASETLSIVDTGSDIDDYRVRWHLKNQKSQAISVELHDKAVAAGGSTYGGATWTGISLEAGVKKGTEKGPTNNRQ